MSYREECAHIATPPCEIRGGEYAAYLTGRGAHKQYPFDTVPLPLSYSEKPGVNVAYHRGVLQEDGTHSLRQAAARPLRPLEARGGLYSGRAPVSHDIYPWIAAVIQGQTAGIEGGGY